MANHSNAFYLDLEEALHRLRVHFDMSRGASNYEVVEWAKFYQDWSRKALHYCGPWSIENLRHAENFVKNLEKSKVGIMGYEVLERVMGEAAMNLNSEILKAVRDDGGIKQSVKA